MATEDDSLVMAEYLAETYRRMHKYCVVVGTK
jgi:hypothetical protein